MASQGPNNPAVAINDDSVGFRQWTNLTIGQIEAEDGVEATTGPLGNAQSHYLKALDFGFAIPLTATIDSITVEVKRRQQTLFGSPPSDSSVRLVKGGVIDGEDKAVAGTWPTTATYQSYGSDLWGLTLTPADVNDATFGFVIAAQGGATLNEPFIDHIRITVDYTDVPIIPSDHLRGTILARPQLLGELSSRPLLAGILSANP